MVGSISILCMPTTLACVPSLVCAVLLHHHLIEISLFRGRLFIGSVPVRREGPLILQANKVINWGDVGDQDGRRRRTHVFYQIVLECGVVCRNGSYSSSAGSLAAASRCLMPLIGYLIPAASVNDINYMGSPHPHMLLTIKEAHRLLLRPTWQ